MIFRKREERVSYDSNEIKRAVENTGPSQLDEKDYSKPSFSYKDSEFPDTAPLFVKVEKYREIVGSINELKRFISGIKQLFIVMNELQEIQNNSVNMLRAHVQRLEKSVEWVDQSLLRPAGFEEPMHGEVEVRQIEQSLSELQREIS